MKSSIINEVNYHLEIFPNLLRIMETHYNIAIGFYDAIENLSIVHHRRKQKYNQTEFYIL